MKREPDWLPGCVIAASAGGWLVVYDGEAPDGTACGHIVNPAGDTFPPKDLLNLMKFGVWHAPRPGDPQSSPPIPWHEHLA